VIPGGPQIIPDNNILPFFFNTPAPTNAQFDQVALTFPRAANTALLIRATIPRSATHGRPRCRPPSGLRQSPVPEASPQSSRLQYTQLVMLDFNGIHGPHVTVGTLVKQ
jgi:hypothetical protein